MNDFENYENAIEIRNLTVKYDGFTFEGGKILIKEIDIKPSEFDESVILSEDGTIVINLYYSRNSYDVICKDYVETASTASVMTLRMFSNTEVVAENLEYFHITYANSSTVDEEGYLLDSEATIKDYVPYTEEPVEEQSENVEESSTSENSSTEETTESETNNLVFVGWDTSSEAKEVVYKPGDVITITEDITLYPVFKEAQTEEEPDESTTEDETSKEDESSTEETSEEDTSEEPADDTKENEPSTEDKSHVEEETSKENEESKTSEDTPSENSLEEDALPKQEETSNKEVLSQ